MARCLDLVLYISEAALSCILRIRTWVAVQHVLHTRVLKLLLFCFLEQAGFTHPDQIGGRHFVTTNFSPYGIQIWQVGRPI